MKNSIVALLFLLLSSQLNANNLAISSPVYSAETLSFTISWDNSWNISSGPSNHDAVWIFVKRQKCTGNNEWVHQLVSTNVADHSAKTGVSPSTVVSVVTVADGVGVFIKRIGTNVTGNVASQTIKLKLASTNPSITTSASDNFKVIGFEMVYVPQGEFYLGDGRTTNINSFSAGKTTQPLKVTNDLQNTTGLGSYSNYTSSPSLGCSVALPTTFPIGYNGFYSMKYEILQGPFVEYLNTMTYDQQALRLKVTGNDRIPNGTPPVSFADWNGLNIVTSTAGNYNTKPAVFTTAYPHIPMGFMNWQDLTSFLDWSGLRPMTEFEYEKACRGNNSGVANAPVANEYPWGNTIITGGNLGNYISRQLEASAVWGVYDGACRYYDDAGPVRSGFAATATSNRSQAGATYYGIMEMGGNVSEQCVGGGSGYDYSSFTTINGNGVISEGGLANVTGWPPNGGTNGGSIIKGGSFNVYGNTYLIQVSDRTYYAGENGLNGLLWRDRAIGGRGVRSF